MWHLLLIIVIVVASILLSKKVGIEMISKKTNMITSKLQNIIKNEPSWADLKTYSGWLSDSNPQELWSKISSKYSNRKKLGDLGKKIVIICELMNRTIEADQFSKTLIESGAFNALTDLALERQRVLELIKSTALEIKNQIAFL